MLTREALCSRLRALIGTNAVRTDTSAYTIDARKPTLVVQPETAEQVADVLKLAACERLAVVPWGQGTQMHLGAAPRRYDLAVSLAALTRIIDYDEANLTVIAEAGLPLRDIYRMSVPKRQFLPLGFPGTAASLGGLLVTNTSGVKRLRYGGIRDLLLGVRVALPEGSLVRFGGRVVKNVAGYDMNKLFIGSLGAFGMVLETTYRLAALPEDDQMLAVVFPTLSHATAAAAAVLGSQLLPSALTLLSAGAACPVSLPPLEKPEQVVLVLNFDGTHEAVARQMRDSRAYCQAHGAQADALITEEGLLSFWEFQQAWHAAPTDRMQLQVRIGVPPTALEETVRHLGTSAPCAPPEIRWLADYGSGQIVAHFPLHETESAAGREAVQNGLQQLRACVREHHGYGVVEYAPAALRRQLDVWGESPGSQLLKRYKQQFDPHAVLNPGRYVAGL